MSKSVNHFTGSGNSGPAGYAPPHRMDEATAQANLIATLHEQRRHAKRQHFASTTDTDRSYWLGQSHAWQIAARIAEDALARKEAIDPEGH